jgi:phosphoribosylformylglycinamidine synthase
MGGNLGLQVHLDSVPRDRLDRDHMVLFSESAGRFILTIDPKNKAAFEEIFSRLPHACIGTVTDTSDVVINGLDGRTIVSVAVDTLKTAWKRPFGGLI